MIKKYHFKSLLSMMLSATIIFSSSQYSYAAEMETPFEIQEDEITETALPSGTPDSETSETSEYEIGTISETEIEVETEVETQTEIKAETESDAEMEYIDETEFFEYAEPDTASDADDSSFYPEYVSGTIKDGYYILKVSSASIQESGANKVIQNALNYAVQNATDTLPCKIMIEPGTYTLTRSLSIYSNTCLYMEGVTFVQAKSSTGNMLRVGKSTEQQNGYFYKNITIDGGTSGGIWDEDYNNHTALKVAHTQNFTARNITVQNTIDGHLMEVAGVNGFSLIDCTFQNQLLDATRYTEAVQFDVLVSKHLSGYTSEDLTNCNILISGCTFSNVPKGIGSHTLILNNYMSNIEITNNTFVNNTCAAIDFVAATNCTISNNTITDCPRGILFYAITSNCEGTYLSSTPAKEGGITSATPTSYMTPPENQNININNNRITCSGDDKYNPSMNNTGIFVGGYVFPSGQTPVDGDPVPAGDYYISGVSITGNSISTTKDGIVLRNVKNARVEGGNQITFSGSDTSCYGIQVTSLSENCMIQGNGITGCSGTSISVTGSSSGILLAGNVITSSTYCGIYAYDSTVSSISENSIISAQGYGILVNQAAVQSISKNVISEPANDGINVYNNAYVKSISENTITSSGAIGIHVSGIGEKLKISSNILKKCKTAQIFVNVNSNANAVTMYENRITGIQTAFGIFVNSGKISVYDNKIVSCRIPVQLTDVARGTIKNNTYKKNKKDVVRITSASGSTCYKNLSKPSSLKASKKDKTSIQLTWKKVSGADGYIIYRADSANGTFKKIGKVSKAKKTTYTDKKLKKNKKYYYQIVAYKKSANKYITLYSSSSKTVAKKL